MIDFDDIVRTEIEDLMRRSTSQESSGYTYQPPSSMKGVSRNEISQSSGLSDKRDSAYGDLRQDFTNRLPDGIREKAIVGGISKSASYGLGDPINNARMKAGMRPISSSISLNTYLNDLWNGFQKGDFRDPQSGKTLSPSEFEANARQRYQDSYNKFGFRV